MKAKLFIEFGQFIERLTARTLRLTPVGKNILCSNPPVRANLPMRNLLFIEKLYEMGPLNIEQVSRLLRRQLGMDRHKRHCVAARHLLKDVEE